MKIEDIFATAENGTVTLEQFQAAVNEAGAKFVDLSEGEYVSQRKYTSELHSLEQQIETLTETLNAREADIQNFQTQLAEAGADEERLAEVSRQLEELQTKYDADAEAYETQLANQAREFAVREYAATKEFTSSAAQKYYIEQMINSEDVGFNRKGELEGMEDFDAAFGAENEGAFKPAVVEQPEPEPQAPVSQPKPTFAASTPGAQKPETTKLSLSEMMQAKNENPEMSVSF